MRMRNTIALVLALGLVLLTACGAPKAPSLPEPTDELVVYCPPWMHTFVEPARALFEKAYPDVQLTYRTFGSFTDPEAVQSFKDLLIAELNAGKGPDLVLFTWDTFGDMYKVMDAGAFYDLDQLMDADASFDPSAYLTEVLDGGVYQGKRQFVPLMFTPAYVMAERAALEAKGVALPENPDFAEWSAALVQYVERHTLEENRQLFDNVYPRFDFFLVHSGLQILNYETKEILVESEEFRQFMAFFKVVYPFSCTSLEGKYPWRVGAFEDILSRLLTGELLFDVTTTAEYIFQTHLSDRADTLRTDTLFSFPRLSGEKTIGMGMEFAAIKSASPNKANAYAFLKILLSDRIQDKAVMPVLKSSMALQTSTDFVRDLEGENATGLGYTRELEYYRNYSARVIDLVYQEMLPYFEERQPYETCLARLKNQLELYLNE